MVLISAEASIFRPWIICEPARRWLTAVRRFAPLQMPPPLVPLVMPGHADTAVTMLAGQQSGIILWSVAADTLPAACDRLAETAIAAPGVLQLVAVQGLSVRQRLFLAEFPCAAAVSNPEDLPRLTPMIQGYFASSAHSLD